MVREATRWSWAKPVRGGGLRPSGARFEGVRAQMQRLRVVRWKKRRRWKREHRMQGWAGRHAARTRPRDGRVPRAGQRL